MHWLTDELSFPPPRCASPEGLVAVGGDARPERLLLAYSLGIFPWPSPGMPLLWFCPDPRFVLRPHALYLSRSLGKRARRVPYRITVDQAFPAVMQGCADTPRPGQQGTWITEELRTGYVALHAHGLAHSVEAWQGGLLVGGLYGLALGGTFFGESMFARAPDASKLAFLTLAAQLKRWDFDLIDCQVPTEHLARFGAEPWPRSRFLRALAHSVTRPSRRGPWQLDVGDTAAAWQQLSAARP
ncbi:MAG: leucyl/phenylalanyl-tRNA--protein transferase [Polyangiales bacterium]